MDPSRTHRFGRLARMTRLALDLGISSLAYYGCALAGLNTLHALLTATGVAAAWLAATALYDRRADGLAIGMLPCTGCRQPSPRDLGAPAAAPARPAGERPRGAGVPRQLPERHPATAYLAGRLHGHPLRDPLLRRAHRTQTLVMGAGLTAEAFARILSCTRCRSDGRGSRLHWNSWCHPARRLDDPAASEDPGTRLRRDSRAGGRVRRTNAPAPIGRGGS